MKFAGVTAYPETPTAQNFASCVQLCRWRSAWVARARRPGATAASRCSMTVGEPSWSRGRAAFGCESERRVVRNATTVHEQHGAQLAVGREDHIAEHSDDPLLPPNGLAAQRLERERAGPVEAELVLLEQDERRMDRQRVVTGSSGRQWQEAVDVVAAQDVETDHTQAVAIQQDVGRTAQLDSVQLHR